MRPIRRNISPQSQDFKPYDNAQPYLISRLGPYCSYCERRVVTNLAVEHIQPKALIAYAHLKSRWENFLLACVNCNSTKKNKDVLLTDVLLPDRDNTFVAYTYTQDGQVQPSNLAISNGLEQMAITTLTLTGLDKKINSVMDENGKQVAIDRVSQRLEAWAVAEVAKIDVDNNPNNNAVKRLTVELALANGFFSIWMTVFQSDADMRCRLINAFSGTNESGCFDVVTGEDIFPSPNLDRLPYGGKI